MRLLVDAKNLDYRELNSKVRKFLSSNGANAVITIKNVLGQRYIGDGLKSTAYINIHGTPGNDLGAFMDGTTIEVLGNGQDGIGNTMNSGKIIIHGDAGDIVGYSMRGGEIYIEKNIGFRGGIHMKSYLEKVPVIVIGGSAGNFLGEYMAGGIIILLGIYKRERQFFPYSGNSDIAGNYIGTGMHGGRIYIRGDIDGYKLGKEVKKTGLDNDDLYLLDKYISNYNKLFNSNKIKTPVGNSDFIKLMPYSHRPYGKLYAY
jgi:glutamate synthase domain-containing protein 3